MFKRSSNTSISLLLVLSVLVACSPAASTGGSEGVKSGEGLFKQSVIENQVGCATCHSLEPDKTILGPSLAGVATRAETRVSGISAEEYLRQSILEPDVHIVDNFPSGVMPAVYADVLSDVQTDNLVDYLLTLK